MDKGLTLLMCLHNHQPVGNFDHVFRTGMDECYLPFLREVAAFPEVKFTVHVSGPLLEWADENSPEYVELLVELAGRGQAEIMGGGFYEPILGVLPDDDAVGQLIAMNDYWDSKGVSISGAWTTERIWEQRLCAFYSKVGIRYTILDDQHFAYTGHIEKPIDGFFATEKAGQKVHIFPTDMKLRYLIPFGTHEELLSYLRDQAERKPGSCLTYGDDGEKFGMWPGTKELVFDRGWLRDFFGMLKDNSSWLRTSRITDYLDNNKSRAMVYIPEASYEEMLEWALPAGMSSEYIDIRQELEDRGELDRLAPFLRGGLWENFFIKYPESNEMHKKMIRVSRRFAEAGSRYQQDLVRDIYRAQCNCAYWHGLFGGVYLNYLRHAIYEKLLSAEAKMDAADLRKRGRIFFESGDYDLDGVVEHVAHTKDMVCNIKPASGGAFSEISYKPAMFNICNMVSRRREAYHTVLDETVKAGDASSEEVNPHLSQKRIELKSAVPQAYDILPRFSCMEYLTKGRPQSLVAAGSNLDIARNFAKEEFECRTDSKEGTLVMESSDSMLLKKVSMRWNGFNVDISSPSTPAFSQISENDLWLVSEWNLTLLAEDADDRELSITTSEGMEKISMGGYGDREKVRAVTLKDSAFGFTSKLKISPGACFSWYPVYTLSQSEKAYEQLFQGVCIMFAWPAGSNNIHRNLREGRPLFIKLRIEEMLQT